MFFRTRRFSRFERIEISVSAIHLDFRTSDILIDWRPITAHQLYTFSLYYAVILRAMTNGMSVAVLNDGNYITFHSQFPRNVSCKVTAET